MHVGGGWRPGLLLTRLACMRERSVRLVFAHVQLCACPTHACFRYGHARLRDLICWCYASQIFLEGRVKIICYEAEDDTVKVQSA